MTERESAIVLANKVLDRSNADPDDDLAVLARQLLRAREMLEWYGERAKSLANHDWKSGGAYALAIFTELSLDAGRRAGLSTVTP